MSTVDPFDQRIAELSNGIESDPFEERMAELSGVRSGPLDEESRGAWNRFLDTVANYAETIEAFTPTGMFQPGANARRAALLGGVVGGGLIEPAKGLVGIPTAVAAGLEDNLGVKGLFLPARTFSRKAENFLERSKVGIYSIAEEAAKGSGVTDDELTDAYAIGNFIGFMAPVSASIKGAGLLLRTPAILQRHAFTGTLITDTVAGAIYGASFKEGDTLEERGKNLLHESALFGIGRIVLNGLPLAFAQYRIKRLRDLDVAAEVEANMTSRLNTAAPPIGSDEGAIGLARLLSEENYLASSAAAQDILARNADETALVKAIIDVNRAKASGGRVRGFARGEEETQTLITRFREQFPGLKFEPRKNPDGSFDLIFGTRGLSNRQRAQLAAETREGWANPRFDGMKVFRGSDEFTYIGRATRPDYVKLRRADETVVEVLERNITDLPVFEEAIERTPALDALYQDFSTFFRENGEKIADSTGSLSEASLVRLAREGKLKMTDEGRRAFDVGGAIIHPEELGLRTGPEGISGIRLINTSQVDPAAGFPNPRRALIHRNTIPGEGPWRLTVLNETPGRAPVRHEHFPTLEEAIQRAQVFNYIPERIDYNHPIAAEVNSLISKNGIEYANILDTPGVVPFEEAFDNWIAARGLPMDASDIGAARAAFAQRLRKEAWDSVPAEDRKIFDAVRAELDKAFDEGAIPFDALAHSKGFHVERSGDLVELREINTGARFPFGSERFASEFLREVVRDEKGLSNLLDLGANGMGSLTGGFRNPAADDWNVTMEAIMKQTAEQIPQSAFRNVRDWFISLEQTLKIPLFTRGFSEVDSGYSRMRGRYEPYGKLIQDSWKGLSRNAREDVVKFWMNVEGKGLTIEQTREAAKAAGLRPAQIRAFEKARAIWDEGFRLAGLPPSRYINNYYGRVKPWLEKNNGPLDLDEIFGADGVPAEFEFFAEMSRTGERAMVEMDPEIVMHKWFRSLFFKQEVKPAWDRMAQLVDHGFGKYKKPALKIRELPQETIDSLIKANPRIDLNDPVLAAPIRDVISEYLTIIRGNPGTGLEKLRWFSRKFFSSIGIEADERVLEEYFNTYMSGMYGAAMGARPSLVARNQTQTMWNLYPRLGNRFSNLSLARAMSKEGFDEALDAGAIRLAEAGIPYGDAIFEHMMGNMRLEGSGPLSNAVAGAVRKGLRLGWVSRKTAEKILIPYSSGDQVGRSWAYWWQKMHTERVLNAFETRRIGWEKFEEDGLPFFARAVKDEFASLYRNLGKEEALRFIGKQASDETHFIYGVGAQPAWMQRPLGRLFGMFGTWPLWAHELYFRRMSQGSFNQKAAFWARNAALMGIFGNMSYQSGVDLWNWISPGGVFGWSGGPAVDHAINLKRLIDAPLDQKAGAAKRLVTDMGRLALPGQVFVQYDLPEALAQPTPGDAFLRLMVGKPVDHEHFAMSYMFSGDDVPNYGEYSPETKAAIEPVAPRPMNLPSVEEMMNMLNAGVDPMGGASESFNQSSSGFGDLSELQGNF